MADNDRRLWTEVEGHEHRYISERRKGRQDTPLTGLAISGGGIRSATFALGVLESLKEHGILEKLDLLSTVSGGGYIGSWLTAGCWRDRNWLRKGTDWLPSISHLRRYSNYLSPSVGFFSADTWSMITIWLRNTLLIQATVILAVACVLLVPRPLFELFLYWPNSGNWRWLSILLFILGIVGIAGNQMRLTSRSRLLLKASDWPYGVGASVLCVAAAWIFARATGFDPFHGGEVSYRTALPVAALLVAGGFALQPVAVLIVKLAWPGSTPPSEINYTQNWVQSVVVVPLVIAAYLVTAVLWSQAIGTPDATILSTLDTYGEFLGTAWKYWPFPLSVVFVSFWLLSFWGVDKRWHFKGLAAWISAPIAGVAVMHALLSAVMLLFHQWVAQPDGAVKTFVFGPPLVAFSFVLAVVMLIGMVGRQSTDDVREWWSRLGAWLGIYATAWMVIAISAVYGPAIINWIAGGSYWAKVSASATWIGTVAGGLLAGSSASTSGEPTKSVLTRAKEILASIAPFVFLAGLLLGVGWLVDEIIALNANDARWATAGTLDTAGRSVLLSVSLLVLAACVALLALMAARVDINLFSLNAFYRNRLVRCYLGATRVRKPQNFTGFDGDDDIPLAKLATGPGPLHIVNCALNLGGSTDLALHTRHSASFTLNPLYCGSAYESRDEADKPKEVGYVSTAAYGGQTGAPTLGQAISVSGAAASPNMGYHTSPVTAFLLTLFNVRLGWWFPNPMKAGSAASPWFSLSYLLSELFGGATDKSRFLMISDGGHFENLAAYELIRRRCGIVIISDGECDPKLTFEGLGTLIRVCEVDRLAKIDIKVQEIHGDGVSSKVRHAIGTINYGPGLDPGVLIYLKASMTGKDANEDTPVLQYKAAHPLFPHESTGDQFYREDQFESYRHLGYSIADEAIDAARSDTRCRPLFAQSKSGESADAALTPS
jgi:hypothetical protein